MNNIMIYQVRLECNNCSNHYNLKVPVDDEPVQFQQFKDWTCNKCKSGTLIVTSMKRVE